MDDGLMRQFCSAIWLFVFYRVKEPHEISFAGIQFESHQCTPGLYITISEALSKFNLRNFDVANG